MNNNKQFKNGHSKPFPLKGLVAAVLLSCAAGTASAEIEIGKAGDTTLSMYGVLDINLQYQSHETTGGDEAVGIETNSYRPSLLGFKGTRLLDNGDTAFFNLEAHFDLDTGMFHQDGGTSDDADDDSGRLLWRRQANLGLSGDWGTLIAGRQYGPAILASIPTEPRLMKENMSNLYPWALGQVFTTVNDAASTNGRNANNDVGVFFKNAIQYRNNISGLDFGVMYAFGAQEGSFEDGNVISLGATYTIDDLLLSGSWQLYNDQQSGEDVVTNWHVGAAYSAGDLTYRAQFIQVENNDALGNEVMDIDALGLGVDWKWSNKNTATVAYYINEDKAAAAGANETKSLVLSNDYVMAESTVLYTQMAVVDVDDGMGALTRLATSVVANAATPAGETTTVIEIGLNYAF